MHEELPDEVESSIDYGATEIGANAADALPGTIVGTALALVVSGT